MGLTVAKVGGSLYDLPDLGTRLRRWMAGLTGSVLFVPGGGRGADVIRQLDRIHQVGENHAHWLALRVLSLNAEFLATLIQGELVRDHHVIWAPVNVLDAYAFCQSDAGQTGELEHSWRVTSDAIAARVAEVAKADLVLLKSTNLPDGTNWDVAAPAGLVDEAFAPIVKRASLSVQWVNLRTLI